MQIDHQYNKPYVALEFDGQGARLFERITEDNVKKRLAIVLDGQIYSAPVIEDVIPDGAEKAGFSTAGFDNATWGPEVWTQA